jgi:hypothetical protein
MPVRSLQEAIPDERDLEETQDLGRATAEATAPDHSQGGIRAQVQFDYEKAEDNEIELREGEFVTEIEMVDKDWWLGVNARGEHGLFPGNYVEVVEDDEAGAAIHEHAHEPVREPSPEPEPVHVPAPAPVPAAVPAPPPVAPASSKGQTATALYDYEAAEDNEISFPENAKILNVVSDYICSLLLYPEALKLTCDVRNSRMTIGGLESTMANRDCSLPTTSNWIRYILCPCHSVNSSTIVPVNNLAINSNAIAIAINKQQYFKTSHDYPNSRVIE